MNRLLTAREVAEVLHCGYRHVHLLRKRGILPAIDITANTPEAEVSRRTGTYRFDEADVRAFVEGRKAESVHTANPAPR